MTYVADTESLMEDQVEVHVSFQSFCSVQGACSIGDAQAVKARVGPSSLVKMWVAMMSQWTAAIDVHSPWPEVEVVEEQEVICIVFNFEHLSVMIAIAIGM